MTLRTLPIRQASNRPNLFMGGDRELVMLSGLLGGILVFVVMDWCALIVGLVFWFASLWLLRLMAKSDPNLRGVYLRHRRYQSYYPARSTPFRSAQRRHY